MKNVYSADDKIKCLRREIAMRERVYPRRVEQGKMTEKTAEWELGCMQAILEDVVTKSNDRYQQA